MGLNLRTPGANRSTRWGAGFGSPLAAKLEPEIPLEARHRVRDRPVLIVKQYGRSPQLTEAY